MTFLISDERNKIQWSSECLSPRYVKQKSTLCSKKSPLYLKPIRSIYFSLLKFGLYIVYLFGTSNFCYLLIRLSKIGLYTSLFINIGFSFPKPCSYSLQSSVSEMWLWCSVHIGLSYSISFFNIIYVFLLNLRLGFPLFFYLRIYVPI